MNQIIIIIFFHCFILRKAKDVIDLAMLFFLPGIFRVVINALKISSSNSIHKKSRRYLKKSHFSLFLIVFPTCEKIDKNPIKNHKTWNIHHVILMTHCYKLHKSFFSLLSGIYSLLLTTVTIHILSWFAI